MIRWLLGLFRREPVETTTILEFPGRVVEIFWTTRPGWFSTEHEFNMRVLSGPPWTEEEADHLLFSFYAELARLRARRRP